MPTDITPILVTGATGTQGGSGRAVVETLVQRGRSVRALVRSLDQRTDVLKKIGAEVVVGDFMQYASVVDALNGVKSDYFCYPVAPGLTEAAGLFAAAGQKQGLQTIVDLSLAASRPDSPSPQGRAQWVAEQIFEWAGFSGAHLRIAAFFMENVALLDGPGIRANARVANSFGDLALPWISGEDVGALAANILLNPKLASTRAIYAGGVERLTYAQVADTVSSISGSPVRYEELTPDRWHTELVNASAKAGEANVRGADHLVAQSVTLRANPIPSIPDHVLEFTGRAPISFAKYVVAHRAELTPGVSIRSKEPD
jgi:NAD(P)H dehydrogenase (quinone)